jgi:hypothetical protein
MNSIYISDSIYIINIIVLLRMRRGVIKQLIRNLISMRGGGGVLGYAVEQWLRHYATIRKVADSRPDEVNLFFFSDYLIFWILGFTQPLTEINIRIRKIMFLGSRARPVFKADNLNAIC